MKLVLTLLARDEADVVDELLRFHLERGVDFVVATDHRSADGTSEILRRYEREGHLHLTRENGEACRQGEWVTTMARRAAIEFGADWVINCDADEFWWAREGTIKEVLAAVPRRFGAIRGLWRHFVPRPEGPEPFYERMTVRRLPESDSASPYHAQMKIAHRADRDVIVPMGNHDVWSRRLLVLREWFPLDVLHFPIRSRDQMARKYLAREPEIRDPASKIGAHARMAVAAIRAEGAAAVFRRLLVDDADLAAGLASGQLIVDTRLRDALRGGRRLAHQSNGLDRAGLVEEIDALASSDATVRLGERMESLERRLSAVESAGVFRRARR